MRRIIVTIGGLATIGLIAGCAPAYVEPGPARPVYGPNYGYGYGYRDGRHERHERHEAREHEEHEEHEHHHDGWRAPEDHD
jgi:hypothetical protein